MTRNPPKPINPYPWAMLFVFALVLSIGAVFSPRETPESPSRAVPASNEESIDSDQVVDISHHSECNLGYQEPSIPTVSKCFIPGITLKQAEQVLGWYGQPLKTVNGVKTYVWDGENYRLEADFKHQRLVDVRHHGLKPEPSFL